MTWNYSKLCVIISRIMNRPVPYCWLFVLWLKWTRIWSFYLETARCFLTVILLLPFCYCYFINISIKCNNANMKDWNIEILIKLILRSNTYTIRHLYIPTQKIVWLKCVISVTIIDVLFYTVTIQLYTSLKYH